MFGPAMHSGKDTAHNTLYAMSSACVAPTMLEELKIDEKCFPFVQFSFFIL